MLEAKVTWSGGMRFEGVAGSGGRLAFDYPADKGGRGDVPSPMEATLLALGGCTGMDVISILKKMREPVTGLEIRVAAERTEEHPRVFKSFVIEYIVEGEGLKEANVQKAVNLSKDKYCSVSAMLTRGAKVEYRVSVVDKG